MKSGGGTPKAPEYATPNIHAVADANGVTAFGQTSKFNPQYTSWLPTNGASAQLGDPSRQEFGPGNLPIQQQQEAEIERQKKEAAAAASGAGAANNAQNSRAALVQLLLGNGRGTGRNFNNNGLMRYGGDNHAGSHN